ncbi:integrase arm-type DNA-binding domain-containing protein [uncultured Desulfuromusa sp.]|uniref:tyrosine-type recombinase/integrase n=1 Tax=uncultured Desulfuromusa sp. TaxID=219183 RepID=UPI002AA6F9DB|nr:integrase arm-type DNA-binding domain-containing protein [uncultured Desulfuromusa sp.]
MGRKTTPLTDIQVRNAKPVAGKQATIFDGGGLYLLISKTGDKGWRFKYRTNGKDKLMSFGTYPEVSLAEARHSRENARKLIAKGIDPQQDKQEKKRLRKEIQEYTFKRIAVEWHEKQTDLAETTKNLHRRRLEKDIYPAIGEVPITEITPKLVLDKVLRPMENRGVGELTARVKSIISQVFRFGVACGYVERDITTDLTGALKKVQRGHRAAITEPTELAKLLRVIDDYDGNKTVKHALQLAPLLFVRPGELRAMKWSEIDFNAAEWRFTASKTKSEHIVPLAKQAVQILQSLQPATGICELVFPSVRSTARPISDNTLNAALRRMGYSKEEVSAHGFRATARTILEEVLQERVEYIEHQLAHQVKDALGRAYNRTKHLNQRHRMMQRWADYLDGLKAGARVIPITRAKSS